MNSLVVFIIMIVLFPAMIIFWNRQRVKGKMLCYFVRKDKSVIGKLCELKGAFVYWSDFAYDVYPDLVRVAKFPMGWPAFLQELVPASLYDEQDAIPLDWINMGNRLERAMELRAALDENWLRKLVHEAAAEGGGFQINWRRVLPIALIAVGVIGFVFIMFVR